VQRGAIAEYNLNMNEAPESSWFQFGTVELLVLVALLAVVWGFSLNFPSDFTLAPKPVANDNQAMEHGVNEEGIMVGIRPTTGTVIVRGVLGSTLTICVWAALRRWSPMAVID